MRDTSLDEILAEPIVCQLMRRDAVDPADLRALMARLRRRPERPAAGSEDQRIGLPAERAIL